MASLVQHRTVSTIVDSFKRAKRVKRAVMEAVEAVEGQQMEPNAQVNAGNAHKVHQATV